MVIAFAESVPRIALFLSILSPSSTLSLFFFTDASILLEASISSVIILVFEIMSSSVISAISSPVLSLMSISFTSLLPISYVTPFYFAV